MTTKYLRLSEIFAEVCDLPPDQQCGLINERCANDPELRAELERMLRLDASTGILDDDRISSDPELPAAVPFDFEVPESVGRFRIKRILGQGGMGVVYLAEQDEPRRDVAVKVIRPGIFSRELLKRFKLETDMLGQLQHSGIAQILEAGTADVRHQTGQIFSQPYFAMEFVDGVPITQFAAEHGLSIRQKLQLIVEVCQAVHAAHQRGVIHRDLKPGNILVMESGQIKLLDFGVARYVSREQNAGTLATQHGQLIGTPAYMSPEQATGNPDEIDTRSDVYTIGVVLYELLSGRLPHRVDEAPLPESIRQSKSGTIQKLSHWDSSLRGDVETIVQKSLENNRPRRYQSASELAADINRYLNGLPIEARPASTWYRFRKFAARQRALVGGMASVFVVLLAGIATTTWQARQAIAQRKAATEQALRANETSALLRRMINAATPEIELGSETTIRQLLDQNSRELRADQSIHPIVAADAHQILADAYFSLGQYAVAREHAERAYQLHTGLSGPNGADSLYDQMTLAMLMSNLDLDDQAMALARDGLARARQHLAPDHDTLIALINARGFTQSLSDNPDQSAIAELHREAYELTVKKYGPHHVRSLRFATNLGVTLLELDALDEAERLLRDVYDVRQRQLGDKHPDTLVAAFNLALLLDRQEKFEEAAEFARTQIGFLESVLGSDHPRTIRFHCLLTRLEMNLGRFAEAELHARAALDSAIRRLGPIHQDTIKARGLLANVLIMLNRPDEAEPLALEQQRLVVQEFGPRHPQSVLVATLLFDLAENRGDVEKMEQLAEQFFGGTEWEKPAQEMIEKLKQQPK